MRDSTGKITRMLNFLMGFNFEIHHIPGSTMESIGPDILSRSMLPLNDQAQDILAKKLEKPILKLNHRFSPFLSSWFSIESPQISYFDENNDIIITKQTLGYELPTNKEQHTRGKEEKLYCNLKKIIKKDTMETKEKKQDILPVRNQNKNSSDLISFLRWLIE